MNIFLTGSHGSGKTSVAEIIAEKTELGVLPSASRISPYKHGTEEHQRYVMDKVYKRCMTYENVIHERTPLDVISYTNLFEASKEYNPQKMKVERFFAHITQTHQKIFYFPILFDLKSDGVRPGKWEQIKVDKYIFNQLVSCGVNFIEVPMGTPEERAEFILKEVGNHSYL